MTRIVTFGEIMGRLAPEGVLRFRQCLPGSLQVTFAGAEANVAVSIAFLGGNAAFVTALPRNAIADACVADLRSLGVDTQFVLRTDSGRFGLYFLETGANQRPSNVIYDRSGSAVSLTSYGQYPWPEIFGNSHWLHVTGITLALSKVAAETTLIAVKEARARNLRISCDLNFRKALWRWDPSCSPQRTGGKNDAGDSAICRSGGGQRGGCGGCPEDPCSRHRCPVRQGRVRTLPGSGRRDHPPVSKCLKSGHYAEGKHFSVVQQLGSYALRRFSAGSVFRSF